MKPDPIFEFPRNQTQFQTEVAAKLLIADYLKDGPRTLSRFNEMADEMARGKSLPAVMVRNTALYLLRSRCPYAMPIGDSDG